MSWATVWEAGKAFIRGILLAEKKWEKLEQTKIIVEKCRGWNKSSKIILTEIRLLKSIPHVRIGKLVKIYGS